MTAERYRQIDRVFQAALAYQPAERAVFLDQACADDRDLRREVEALLASDEQAESFIESPALEIAPELMADGLTINDKTPSVEGKTIGHYRIDARLGAGGMGKVFLAQDLKLGRPVALKLLDTRLTADRNFRSRFRREARLASAGNHPNICTIYEINDEGELPFIVMEYVEGETLDKKITSGELDIPETLDIAGQIADALTEAHASGIIHRDLKPANIIVNRRGQVKILDFGLAKQISAEGEEAESQLSQAGMILGTVAYMSPEQAQGFETDARTDVWSFGVVLYEMLTGRRPFSGATITNLLAAILCGEPESPRKFNRGIPDDLDAIVSKALRKDRDQRFESAKDLLFELKRLQKRLKIGHGLFREARMFDETAKLSPSLLLRDSISQMPPNNLTKSLLPIIGREKEIAALKNLLQDENLRLVTMTGVGGTGKTRLSEAVARELLADFSDGIFFIKLAAITNPELVASTIAQPLGVKEAGGKPVIEILKDYLYGRRILLVIDNFEQVIEAAPQIAELLEAAPELKILITSRMLLHLSTEREFAVPPLAVPAETTPVSPDELSNYEAIKLFVQRAQNVVQNFNLTEENAQSVAEICARLDGLPLAIELAAARVKILTPPMILAKLEHRLNLLTGGPRDLPARQQTMRGAIYWSYDLLSEEEKRLFCRLAVFAGGFSLEAAESVVGGRWSAAGENTIADKDIDNDDKSFESNDKQKATDNPPLTNVPLEGITSLVDKSLLVAKEKPGGTMRFRMLEVVREFALEALEASGEAQNLRRSHAGYFLAFGEEAEPHLVIAEAAWLNRFEEENDNLRAALLWLLENEPVSGARLVSAIRCFWPHHNRLTEGTSWYKTALEQGIDAPADVRFNLLFMLGQTVRSQGDYETARKVYEESLELGRAGGDLRQISLSTSGLGTILYQQGDFPAARRFIEEGLDISRRLGDKFCIALALNILGDVERTEGNYPAARRLQQESLLISRQMENKSFVASALNNLGFVAYGESDYKSALSYFAEALAISQESGNKIYISYSLDGLAALAARRGNTHLAAQLAGAAEGLRESVGFDEIVPAESRFREAYIGELRAVLGEAEFSANYEQGCQLEFEEVLARAFAEVKAANDSG